MKNDLRKLLALVLCVTMLSGCVPVLGLAEDEGAAVEAAAVTTPTDLEEDPAEEPAADPEEEPAEEPAVEEPAVEEPAEALLTEGYAWVQDGAAVYADKDCTEKLGAFTRKSIVYVTDRKTEDGADKDVLTVVFAVDGEAVKAYIRAGKAVAMTEDEAAAAAKAEDAAYEGIALTNAGFEAVAAPVEETPAEETPVEETPAEEPAEEEPVEETPAEEPAEEEPAEETPAEEPAEEEPAEEVATTTDLEVRDAVTAGLTAEQLTTAEGKVTVKWTIDAASTTKSYKVNVYDVTDMEVKDITKAELVKTVAATKKVKTAAVTGLTAEHEYAFQLVAVTAGDPIAYDDITILTVRPLWLTAPATLKATAVSTQSTALKLTWTKGAVTLPEYWYIEIDGEEEAYVAGKTLTYTTGALGEGSHDIRICPAKLTGDETEPYEYGDDIWISAASDIKWNTEDGKPTLTVVQNYKKVNTVTLTITVAKGYMAPNYAIYQDDYYVKTIAGGKATATSVTCDLEQTEGHTYTVFPFEEESQTSGLESAPAYCYVESNQNLYAPLKLTAKQVAATDTSVKLTWSKNKVVPTSWRVVIDDDEDNPATIPGKTLTYTAEGLEPGTHKFTVRAVYEGTVGEQAAETTLTMTVPQWFMPDGKPTIASIVQNAKAVGTADITLTVAKGYTAPYYAVYAVTDGETEYHLLKGGKATATSVKLSVANLNEYATYTFFVVPANYAEQEVKDNASDGVQFTFTDHNWTTAPKNLKAALSDKTAGTVKLSWAKGGTVAPASYHVYIDGELVTDEDGAATEVTTTSFITEALDNGEHTFKVVPYSEAADHEGDATEITFEVVVAWKAAPTLTAAQDYTVTGPDTEGKYPVKVTWKAGTLNKKAVPMLVVDGDNENPIQQAAYNTTTTTLNLATGKHTFYVYYKDLTTDVVSWPSDSAVLQVVPQQLFPVNVKVTQDGDNHIAIEAVDTISEGQRVDVYVMIGSRPEQVVSLTADELTGSYTFDVFDEKLPAGTHDVAVVVNYGDESSGMVTVSSFTSVDWWAKAPEVVSAVQFGLNDIVITLNKAAFVPYDEMDFSVEEYASKKYTAVAVACTETEDNILLTISNVKTGKHQYHIALVKDGTAGTYTALQTVTMVAVPACLTPVTGLAAAYDEDTKEISVTWSANAAVKAFNVYVDGSLAAEKITATSCTLSETDIFEDLTKVPGTHEISVVPVQAIEGLESYTCGTATTCSLEIEPAEMRSPGVNFVGDVAHTYSGDDVTFVLYDVPETVKTIRITVKLNEEVVSTNDVAVTENNQYTVTLDEFGFYEFGFQFVSGYGIGNEGGLCRWFYDSMLKNTIAQPTYDADTMTVYWTNAATTTADVRVQLLSVASDGTYEIIGEAAYDSETGIKVSALSFGENKFAVRYAQNLDLIDDYSPVSEVLTVTSDTQIVNNVTYTLNSDDPTTCTVTDADTSAATVTIPEMIDGVTVTAIGEGAFENDTNLVSIDLPDTITVIGARAFKGCTNLSTMN